MKGRLVTGDRLLTWGYKGDVNCIFCRNQLESRDCLFFFNAASSIDFGSSVYLGAEWQMLI
jgi:hypothetical protein